MGALYLAAARVVLQHGRCALDDPCGSHA
jgi:hypothetical protein